MKPATDRMYVVNRRQLAEVHSPVFAGERFARGLPTDTPRAWVTVAGEIVTAWPTSTRIHPDWSIVAARAFPPISPEQEPDLFQMTQTFTGELVNNQGLSWCAEETLRKMRAKFREATNG